MWFTQLWLLMIITIKKMLYLLGVCYKIRKFRFSQSNSTEVEAAR
jgi:hypothetical protein